MTNIYVVRLTEPAHNWLIGLAADVDTSWMSPGNKDIAREASSALESASPENPERQAALEALAEAISCLGDWEFSNFEYFQFNEKMEALGSAIRKFRSLEGK